MILICLNMDCIAFQGIIIAKVTYVLKYIN